MISINTNISSLIAQNSLKKSTLKLNNAIEQMTTGYKINHAKDNAANYSIAVDMSTKIGAYEVAEENCAMALDLLNTANEALGLIADKTARLEALWTQYSNGTYGADSKDAINAEVRAINQEMIRIFKNTEYNGKKLLYEKDNNIYFSFQIGIDDSLDSEISVSLFIRTSFIANYIDTFNPNEDFSNGLSLSNIKKILNFATTRQTELGAVQNQLESALEAISTQRENLISSRSTLKDADVAEVSSEYIKQQILQQASATLLATANQSPALALQLI